MFANLLDLTTNEILLFTGVVFLAGIVRGFTGFALSAVVMASLAIIIPPVKLIPICYVFEAAASITMLRGGLKDADMSVVWGLFIGSATGLPIGLFLTTSISPELSKLLALLVLLALAVLQIFHVSPRFLSSKTGLYLSGITAGIVTGIAGIGGMVVALYVLANKAQPATMRASLVIYLAIGMVTSGLYYLGFGIMTKMAFVRGIAFVPVLLAGVFIGKQLFHPALAPYYKRICLILLIGLALNGLIRQVYSISDIALATK